MLQVAKRAVILALTGVLAALGLARAASAAPLPKLVEERSLAPSVQGCQKVLSLNAGATPAEGVVLFAAADAQKRMSYWVSRLQLDAQALAGTGPVKLAEGTRATIVDAIAPDAGAVIYLAREDGHYSVRRQSMPLERAPPFTTPLPEFAESWALSSAGADGFFVLGRETRAVRIVQLDRNLHVVRTAQLDAYGDASIRKMIRLSDGNYLAALYAGNDTPKGLTVATRLIKLTPDLVVIGEHVLEGAFADIAAGTDRVAASFYDRGPDGSPAAWLALLGNDLSIRQKTAIIKSPAPSVSQPTVAASGDLLWLAGSQSFAMRLFLARKSGAPELAPPPKSNLLAPADQYRLLAVGDQVLVVSEERRLVTTTTPPSMTSCNGIWLQRWRG